MDGCSDPLFVYLSGRSMAFALWEIARCSVIVDTILEYPYEKPKKESIA